MTNHELLLFLLKTLKASSPKLTSNSFFPEEDRPIEENEASLEEQAKKLFNTIKNNRNFLIEILLTSPTEPSLQEIRYDLIQNTLSLLTRTLTHEEQHAFLSHKTSDGWHIPLIAARCAPSSFPSIVNIIDTFPLAQQIELLKPISPSNKELLLETLQHAPGAAHELLKLVKKFPISDKTHSLSRCNPDNTGILNTSFTYARDALPELMSLLCEIAPEDKANILQQFKTQDPDKYLAFLRYIANHPQLKKHLSALKINTPNNLIPEHLNNSQPNQNELVKYTSEIWAEALHRLYEATQARNLWSGMRNVYKPPYNSLPTKHEFMNLLDESMVWNENESRLFNAAHHGPYRAFEALFF